MRYVSALMLPGTEETHRLPLDHTSAWSSPPASPGGSAVGKSRTVTPAAYYSRSATPLDIGEHNPRSIHRTFTYTPFGYSTESRAGFKTLPDPTGSWSRPISRVAPADGSWSRPTSRVAPAKSRPATGALEPWQQTLRSSFPRISLPEGGMSKKDRLFLERSKARWAALCAGEQSLPSELRSPPISGTGLWASAPMGEVGLH